MERSKIFIPLGTRCSTATILNVHFKKRLYSLPFDWVDLPIRNMNQFISVREGEEETFLTGYFKDVTMNTQRHKDGTWFPHDLHTHKFPTTEIVLKNTFEKYLRRLKRLVHVLSSQPDEFIFLTLCAFPETHGTSSEFNLLEELIESKTKSKCTFVTINLVDFDFQLGNHYNFAVPLETGDNLKGENYARWEREIVEKINSDPYLAELFK